MTLGQALSHIAQALKRITPEAYLEAELLLRHVTGYSREVLFVSLDEKLPTHAWERLQSLLDRRLHREPLAYILGRREFYGLEFYVDPRVIIPRPETELLVEVALQKARESDVPLIADIGTGCGAIAISLAVSLPRARVYATDISPAALEVARYNCHRHGVTERVTLLQGDLLTPLPEPVNIITFNPPYIPSSDLERLDPEIKDFEPREALDGGWDGLDVVRRFLDQLPGWLLPGGCFLLEIGAGQDQRARELILKRLPGMKIEVFTDLGGIPRVIKATMTAKALHDKIN